VVVPGLEVAAAETDAELEALIAVWAAAEAAGPPWRVENLRHNLAGRAGLAYLLARVEGEPVGCGFVWTRPPERADGHVAVVPDARGRGIGSALLADVGRRVDAAGMRELQGKVRASDPDSLAFFERRGYRVVGGEEALALDLAAIDAAAPSPPPGIEIVSRLERPELAEELFPVGVEAYADIPGTEALSYELWRSINIDRPTTDPSLFFIALADGEPVGYAAIDNLGGPDAYHWITAVKRDWRRRGVATALKRAQLAAAKRAGFQRVVTRSEERNTPMRNLNAKLGYRSEPTLSEIAVKGPIAR
jgi:mycothiol synthase